MPGRLVHAGRVGQVEAQSGRGEPVPAQLPGQRLGPRDIARGEDHMAAKFRKLIVCCDTMVCIISPAVGPPGGMRSA